MNDSDSTVKLSQRLRRHVIDMAQTGGGSHVGSALSIADIIAVLYGDFLRFDISNPDWEERDRFLLSKGHAGSCVYAALAEIGFFSLNTLKTHYQDGSILSGHVSHKDVPGVEFSTGSLGHALSVSVGMAMSAKLKEEDHRVVCLLSDGECDEGSNWEAIMFAAHHKLSNLTAIVDYNKLQSLASTEETLGLEPFADKWRSFGWEVFEVDGHSHEELAAGFAASTASMPKCVIAHTTKGKGVSFMENQVLWHYRSPQGQEYLDAISELDLES
ncbi:transketolase [Pseudomonadales bacterium]|nr:transketolase [Pseudomonadales bacterium]MDB2543312.1 transketolase [Pseudomonadales bacterium]